MSNEKILTEIKLWMHNFSFIFVFSTSCAISSPLQADRKPWAKKKNVTGQKLSINETNMNQVSL